ADGTRGIAHQLAVFEEATRGMPGERTLANSAATLRFAPNFETVRAKGHEVGVAADWVRPGIMVYGSSPDFPEKTIADWGLRPAMSLRAEVIATQELKAGEQVGYGSRFTADRDMRIGVIACGYADGYPRVVPCAGDDVTPVLIGDVRTRLVGRVSMDMITIDLTPAPEAQVGSVATLWGTSPGGAVLAIDEIAAAAGTVGYELMCALAQRVPTRVE
ncbi:MAG: alanine racemase, partial [Burkholderiales bacterium]